jgi:hypothetical protein
MIIVTKSWQVRFSFQFFCICFVVVVLMQHVFRCENLICRGWRTWKTNRITSTYVSPYLCKPNTSPVPKGDYLWKGFRLSSRQHILERQPIFVKINIFFSVRWVSAIRLIFMFSNFLPNIFRQKKNLCYIGKSTTNHQPKSVENWTFLNLVIVMLTP